jgi:serine/threonine protein kinase
MAGPVELPWGTRVADFVIQTLLGEGGYGQIYRVVDARTNQEYAMKIEYFDAAKQGLEDEIEVFPSLQGSAFFPQFVQAGETDDFRYLVMELLGPSVSALRKSLNHERYTKYSLCHIAFHSLQAIEEFHARGYVHRDVKPGNFLLRPDRRTPIVLIDFGLSRRFVSDAWEHLPPRRRPGYTGTTRYASLHAHDRQELSRRDDLISWFYSLVECARGQTPWPGNSNKQKAMRIKRQISTKQLCAALPSEFREIWEIIGRLRYEDMPHYERIKRIIKRAARGVRGDRVYDWERLSKATLSELTTLPLDMGGRIDSDTAPAGEDNEQDGGCACSVA